MKTFQVRDDFNALLGESVRLVGLLSTHQTRLAGLANGFGGVVEPGSAVEGVSAAPAVGVSELIAALRDLSAEAAALRELADVVRARLAATARGDGHSVGRPVVLIADDSDDNREIAALLLEAAGFQAITAENGLQALIAAHSVRPSVIILDVAMPVLDGIQTARLLKADPATRDSHVIAYTATAPFEGERFPGLFAAVLAKPGEPAAIVALVQRLTSAPR